MTFLTVFVRRAVVGGTLVSAILAPALAAQSSQVAIAEVHQFRSRGLQGFELRQQAGFGTFISDSALRASEHLRLSALLQHHIPSLLLGTNGRAGEFPVLWSACSAGMTCSAPRCYMRILLDGVLMFDGTPQMRDLQGIDVSRLQAQEFSGIEYHASAAGLPAQYGGPNADCGTLMFWSRET